MKKEYDKEILIKLVQRMNMCDRIMLILFKRYTYKILKIGINIGFDWEDKEYECQPKCEKINDLSTTVK
jgi:hypothetical protein